MRIEILEIRSKGRKLVEMTKRKIRISNFNRLSPEFAKRNMVLLRAFYVVDVGGTKRLYVEFICECGDRCMKRYDKLKENWYGCIKCAQRGRRLTNVATYGVPIASQAQEVKDRMVATTQQRYGHDSVSQVPEFKKKRLKRLKRTI